MTATVLSQQSRPEQHIDVAYPEAAGKHVAP
jgi:hypothetical protein